MENEKTCYRHELVIPVISEVEVENPVTLFFILLAAMNGTEFHGYEGKYFGMLMPELDIHTVSLSEARHALEASKTPMEGLCKDSTS